MKSLSIKKNTAFETAWSKYLPIAFLFIQYAGLAKLSICYVYCVIYALLCLLRYGKGHSFMPLIAYTLYFFGYTIFVTIANDLPITGWFYMIIYRYSICIFAVVIISQHLDRDALYKTWKFLGVIVCLAIIYQTIQIYVLHQSVSTIQLIPGQTGGQLEDVWNRETSRPVAFFTEPAMVIAFMTPILFLSIVKKEMKYSIFFSICMALTTSTTGLVVLAILWGYYLYKSNSWRHINIEAVFIICFGLVLLFIFPIFQTALDKLNFELSGESGNAFGRVYSGWLVYAHLDLQSQLFGIPNYDYDGYIRENAGIFANYVSQVRMENEDTTFFFNTAQHIFLRTGAVGGLFYTYLLYRLFKIVDKTVMPYLICVVVSMFFEFSFFYHNAFVIQYILILSFIYKPCINEKYRK